jgi:hypothetical protein
MASRWMIPVSRIWCCVVGHDWTAHRYEAPDPYDLQVCARCGATKRGLPTP